MWGEWKKNQKKSNLAWCSTPVLGVQFLYKFDLVCFTQHFSWIFLYISTNYLLCCYMQLAPLLPQNAHDVSQTTQESAQGLGWIAIVIIFVLFGGMIGAFIHFTLPSRDPIDLGMQTLEMQQTNFCAGRCCSPRSQPPTGKTNGFQTGALVLEIVGNKDCVKCPDYWNLKISDCPKATQTVPA